MTSEEIRATPRQYGYQNTSGGFSFPEGAENFAALMLCEIAVQLAKLNEHLETVDTAVFGK